MPYTPYTLQTILSSPRIEEPIQTSTSTSFFSRRPTSPSSADGVTSPTIRYSSTNRIDSVGAWGNISSYTITQKTNLSVYRQ